MHAFDADKLHGGQIIVAQRMPGEKLAALNGETYELDPSNLVIADPEGAVALAGVIGGAGSAISDTTTRIVLESACFNASSIRKTSSQLKLRTDASMRFEKVAGPGEHRPRLGARAGIAAGSLAGNPAGGRLGRRVSAAANRRIQSSCRSIGWIASWAARFPPAEVRAILESLEFKVDEIASDVHGPCRAGAPPRTSPSRTIWWKKSAA